MGLTLTLGLGLHVAVGAPHRSAEHGAFATDRPTASVPTTTTGASWCSAFNRG